MLINQMELQVKPVRVDPLSGYFTLATTSPDPVILAEPPKILILQPEPEPEPTPEPVIEPEPVHPQIESKQPEPEQEEPVRAPLYTSDTEHFIGEEALLVETPSLAEKPYNYARSWELDHLRERVDVLERTIRDLTAPKPGLIQRILIWLQSLFAAPGR